MNIRTLTDGTTVIYVFFVDGDDKPPCVVTDTVNKNTSYWDLNIEDSIRHHKNNGFRETPMVPTPWVMSWLEAQVLDRLEEWCRI